ncbi:helix-turn-helix domain-containing protein [Streptomyces sp. AK08-01B]
MRAFVAVVEEGGLSAAARRLHISQPALSHTVSGLEREFGVQLLVRSSTGVRPTDAGLTLLAKGARRAGPARESGGRDGRPHRVRRRPAAHRHPPGTPHRTALPRSGQIARGVPGHPRAGPAPVHRRPAHGASERHP